MYRLGIACFRKQRSKPRKSQCNLHLLQEWDIHRKPQGHWTCRCTHNHHCQSTQRWDRHPTQTDTGRLHETCGCCVYGNRRSGRMDARKGGWSGWGGASKRAVLDTSPSPTNTEEAAGSGWAAAREHSSRCPCSSNVSM